jgi:hypothetical protein
MFLLVVVVVLILIGSLGDLGRRVVAACVGSGPENESINLVMFIGQKALPMFFFSQGDLRYFTQTWRNNSFRCLLRRLLRPQDVGHLRLRDCKFFNPFYNLNCSARERAP